MAKKKTCKEKGYHNFRLIGTNGTLPYQEVEVECEDCGLQECFCNDHVDDGESE